MKYGKALINLALVGTLVLAGQVLAGPKAKITPAMESLEVMHQGKAVTIRRIDDENATIPKAYARTSRHCPPFCIQPMQLGDGVETIGELEMLDYIRRLDAGEENILIIDSRMPGSTRRGMIPLAINIPYRDLKEEKMAMVMQEQFDVTPGDPVWNFRDAKTLVMYCNGPWCGQSPTAIKRLLRAGYPASRIKYYRGGMQSWESFGLTVVEP
mgnify:CR=1 FL=1